MKAEPEASYEEDIDYDNYLDSDLGYTMKKLENFHTFFFIEGFPHYISEVYIILRNLQVYTQMRFTFSASTYGHIWSEMC